MKTSVVIHQIYNEINLELLAKDLKVIYNLRSLIAHGNLTELNKLITKKKKEGKEFFILEMTEKLYFIIRTIIEQYLIDPSFINFLKKS